MHQDERCIMDHHTAEVENVAEMLKSREKTKIAAEKCVSEIAKKNRSQSHDQLRKTIMIINIYVTIKLRTSILPIPCQSAKLLHLIR